jgi:hypothetical protein
MDFEASLADFYDALIDFDLLFEDFDASVCDLEIKVRLLFVGGGSSSISSLTAGTVSTNCTLSRILLALES